MCSFLCLLPKCLHWPFCPGVFIAILAVVAGAVTFWEHPPRWFKAISVCVFLLLMSAEVWMMSLDRERNDADQAAARTASENNFREIADGIRSAIADSDRKFAATMGKENQVLENITGGNSFAVVTPQVWSGLVPVPVSIRNQGSQTLTGVTVTIRNARNFDIQKPESFYETESINVGTLHPGELRLMKEKLTPVEHALEWEDGRPADVFDLDIAAQNFTAEEHLIFKKGTRIPWVFRYQVTRQYIKSKHGDTTTFGYDILADQKEWLGEK
jgi:hypothetical protein